MRILSSLEAVFVALEAENGVKLIKVVFNGLRGKRSAVLVEECRLEDVRGVFNDDQLDYLVCSNEIFKLSSGENELKVEERVQLERKIADLSFCGENAAFLVEEPNEGSSAIYSIVICGLEAVLNGSFREMPSLFNYEAFEEKKPRIKFFPDHGCLLLIRDDVSIDVIFLNKNQGPNPRISRFINFVEGLAECGVFNVGEKSYVGAISRSGKFLARQLTQPFDSTEENSSPKLLESEVLVEILDTNVRHAVAFRNGFLVADSSSLWALKVDEDGSVSAAVYVGNLSNKIKWLQGMASTSTKTAGFFSYRADKAVILLDPSSKTDFATDTRIFSRSSLTTLGKGVVSVSKRNNVAANADVALVAASSAEKEAKLAETLRSGLAGEVFKLKSLEVSKVKGSRRIRIEVEFELVDAGLNLLRVSGLNGEPSVFWWFCLKCDFNDRTTTSRSTRLDQPWLRRQTRSFSISVDSEKVGSTLINLQPVNLATSMCFYLPELDEPDGNENEPSSNSIEVHLTNKKLGFEDFAPAFKSSSSPDILVRNLIPLPAFKKFGKLLKSPDDLVDYLGRDEELGASRHGHSYQVSVSSEKLEDLRIRLSLTTDVTLFELMANDFVGISCLVKPEPRVMVLGVSSALVGSVGSWIDKIIS